MDPLEQQIMKQMERMMGYVPIGSLDLLRVLAHPDMIQLTEKYLAEKSSQDQHAL